MAKNKNTEKKQAVESETADIAKSAPTDKKSNKAKFWLTLIALLLLAAGSGVATYYTTPIVLHSLAPQKSLPIMPIKPRIQQVSSEAIEEPVLQLEEITAIEEPNLETNISEIIEEENESEISKLEETEQNSVPEIQEEVAIVAEEEVPETTTSIAVPKHKPYPVLKAIALKESFKNGEECRPLLEEWIAMPNKTPEMEQALVALLQACLERPANGQMQNAFSQTKKRAILRIFQNEYPLYLAYLKALPYFIADVYHKNPTGETPLDILNRIQTAVYADKPHAVVQLIKKLPANVQATLNDVTHYAEAEVRTQKTLNHFMQILFSEGGEND